MTALPANSRAQNAITIRQPIFSTISIGIVKMIAIKIGMTQQLLIKCRARQPKRTRLPLEQLRQMLHVLDQRQLDSCCLRLSDREVRVRIRSLGISVKVGRLLCVFQSQASLPFVGRAT